MELYGRKADDRVKFLQLLPRLLDSVRQSNPAWASKGRSSNAISAVVPGGSLMFRNRIGGTVADDGEGVSFISAPLVRSQRVRFARAPLGRERGGILGWLLRLVGGRKNPFKASAIAFAIDKELGFSRGVLKGDDRTSVAPGSTAVEGVTARLLAYATEAYRRAGDDLRKLGDEIRQEEGWLDQCRPDIILSSLQSKLESAHTETATSMRDHRPALDASRDAVERFQVRHELDEDVRPGKPVDRTVVAQLGLVIVGEFLLNAVYQSTFAKEGLLGGLGIAAGCSLAFVAIGLLIGVCVQRSAKRGGSGLVGYALAAAGVAVAAAFISILNLARVAGDHGDQNPYDTAGAQLSRDFLAGIKAMSDVWAFIFAVISVFVITMIARKFVDYAGDYPHYRRRFLMFAENDSIAKTLIEDAKAEVALHAEFHKQRLDKAPDHIAHCKTPIRSLVVDHENVGAQFRADAQDLRDAGKLFDAFIREYGGAADKLTQQVQGQLDPQLLDVHQGQCIFAARAEQLCAREDVSDGTIEAARRRFSRLIDGAYASLDALVGGPAVGPTLASNDSEPVRLAQKPSPPMADATIAPPSRLVSVGLTTRSSR